MGIISKIILKGADQFYKKGSKLIPKDKLVKKVLSGETGSPFKFIDDTGVKPIYRNITDSVGTEKKKLKEVGKKISEEFKKKGFSGGGIAKRGLGRAFLKGKK
jgi:hypothetical protein|tara:strand:+ start:57 stop:365 length:309 start_codon:yes stop_codon:yes gene_type:complete